MTEKVSAVESAEINGKKPGKKGENNSQNN